MPLSRTVFSRSCCCWERWECAGFETPLLPTRYLRRLEEKLLCSRCSSRGRTFMNQGLAPTASSAGRSANAIAHAVGSTVKTVGRPLIAGTNLLSHFYGHARVCFCKSVANAPGGYPYFYIPWRNSRGFEGGRHWYSHFRPTVVQRIKHAGLSKLEGSMRQGRRSTQARRTPRTTLFLSQG